MNGESYQTVQVATSGLADWLCSILSRTSRSLIVAAPYIQVNALRYILQDVRQAILSSLRVITCWNIDSILAGALDLDIYEYCRTSDIRLETTPHLHAKACIVDDMTAVIGSANITNRGLGLIVPANREILALATLSSNDLSDLQDFFSNTALVTETDYIEASRKLRAQPRALAPQPTIDTSTSACKANLQDVPAFATPGEAWVAYRDSTVKQRQSYWKFCGETIPSNLTRNAFLRCVSRTFRERPLVASFISRIAIGPLYFGQAKSVVRAILQEPETSLRDLTKPTQRLYTWLSLAFPDEFVVDRPHFSERLQRRPQSHKTQKLERHEIIES